jgi:hypothetical protein
MHVLVYPLLLASLASAPVAWTQLSITGPAPHPVEWGQNLYDPVAGKVLLWQAATSNGVTIYSSGGYHLDALDSPASFTELWNSGTVNETCPSDTSAAPGDRHQTGQWIIDPRRNRIIVWGGTCAGVGSRSDMLWADLTATPYVWTAFNLDDKPSFTCQTLDQHLPVCQGRYTTWYDPVVDAYFAFGNDGGTRGFSMFCPTDLNPSPGTLTTVQAQAGCGTAEVSAAFGGPVADGWVEQSSWFGTQPTFVGGSYPPNRMSPQAVYDDQEHLAVLVNRNASVTAAEVWTYDSATRTWTRKNPAIVPPVSYAPNEPAGGNASGTPPLAYIGNGQVWYHPANSSSPGDWVYTVATDAWMSVGNLGGPTDTESLTFVPSDGKLVLWSEVDSATGGIWTISASDPQPVDAGNPDAGTFGPGNGGGAAGQPVSGDTPQWACVPRGDLRVRLCAGRRGLADCGRPGRARPCAAVRSPAAESLIPSAIAPPQLEDHRKRSGVALSQCHWAVKSARREKNPAT